MVSARLGLPIAMTGRFSAMPNRRKRKDMSGTLQEDLSLFDPTPALPVDSGLPAGSDVPRGEVVVPANTPSARQIEVQARPEPVIAAPAPVETAEEEPVAADPVRPPVLFDRVFTTPGTDVFDSVEWDTRSAIIKGEDGRDVFRQEGMEFPKSYSQSATNVIASKYFRGVLGSETRERSVRTMISRVVDTISRWALEGGYLSSEEARAFRDELAYLILHQYGTFNSPVWFNVGVEAHPQCSACFINSVQDDMESILGLVKTEGMLFKFGSGTGTNFSPLRSSKERLRGGGEPSGPVSFMRGYDAFAGVIKSGGKTRRAAKMVILNADHPDIVEFIECKVSEEKKAQALIQAGYDGSFGGEAYDSIAFQNANNSVRVTDEFMKAVLDDREWKTRSITTGAVTETHRARELMQKIARSAHACGDPGMQFDTTVNDWHTCPESGRINASNPCSEFMFLDDSACNLASLNLMKFVRDDGSFDTDTYRHAVRTFILAQEVIVSNAAYPTPAIGANSEKFRPLGLGYANLGAMLMNWGMPYDSDDGRAIAAAVTALMTGEAYAESARIAARVGPFREYARNRDAMLRVVRKHRAALEGVKERIVPKALMKAAREAWDDAKKLGEQHGFRNAQTTLLAPTGTIGFKMDCDTTGIEPELAIVKYKSLVGGGTMKIVNQSVGKALTRLGYDAAAVAGIQTFIGEHGTIEGAPGLKDAHLAVFDCAFKPSKGERSISTDGHVKMMAAVQPFLSGAISKTVNLPTTATVEDVYRTYIDAWQMGLKAVAIYRDGSKTQQPVSTSKDAKGGNGKAEEAIGTAPKPVRTRLADERQSITHKFTIGGLDGYITVGMYEDHTPGEIFITMAKQGSVISGLMDSFATSISIALQYGVPLKVLVDKFSHVRFEPNGYSTNPQIGYAKSIVDYVFRWLELKFLPNDQKDSADSMVPDLEAREGVVAPSPAQDDLFTPQLDAPPCSACGFIMVRSGSCYKCQNCGATSGCS
jgi:ribonucleoside-diphosphate reductase alpha chain